MQSLKIEIIKLSAFSMKNSYNQKHIERLTKIFYMLRTCLRLETDTDTGKNGLRCETWYITTLISSLNYFLFKIKRTYFGRSRAGSAKDSKKI